MIEKFRTYAACLASRREPNPPVDLLVVTASPLRENLIWKTLDTTFEEVGGNLGCVFTSLDTLIQRVGPLGSVCRASAFTGRIPFLGWRSGEGC
jgi:hypothetical protein